MLNVFPVYWTFFTVSLFRLVVVDCSIVSALVRLLVVVRDDQMTGPTD